MSKLTGGRRKSSVKASNSHQDDSPVDWVLTNIGQRLKTIRKGRGMTLAELAESAGFTEGFLSSVENSTIVPSISALSLLAAVLGADLTALFPQEVGSQVTVHRASSDNHLRLSESSLASYVMLSSRLDDPSYTALLHDFLLSSEDSSATYRYIGERFALVLRGEVKFSFGDRNFPLKPGETIHYSSHSEHALEVISETKAEILWLVAPALIR